MATVGRRVSVSSSTLAKRPAAVENAAVAAPGKGGVGSQQAKKRVALGNLTNHCGAGGLGRIAAAEKGRPATTRSAPAKKGPATRVSDSSSRRSSSVTSVATGPTSLVAAPHKTTIAILVDDEPAATAVSPSRSVSMDESMSTCSSIKSPNFEYIDNADSSALASLERRASANLHISEQHPEGAGYTWRRDALMGMDTVDDIVDVDRNHEDPQLCATLACDIYKHLRMAEAKKRPASNYMEAVQKDINPSMRAILVDWLVEVAEEYRLVPDTLHLTVNYIDRFLSGNEMTRQRLQLLGVACMLIASKYEEICAPQVEEFCYITDNTYFRDEVLQMEAAVLRHLKFEMTAPTAKCFLRRFVRVAQWADGTQSLQLEFLSSYLAELTLLEYSFLRFPSSLVAASSVFLAKFMLQPNKMPWNATMCHYTLYKASELSECVKAVHQLVCNGGSTNSLPAIREKYSQHKYKFVAKKYCPPSTPMEFFQDVISSS